MKKLLLILTIMLATNICYAGQTCTTDCNEYGCTTKCVENYMQEKRMKIKTITDQIRRDFRAIFICEHCNIEEKGKGYDDEYFHRKVIPEMQCKECGKKADENYRPLSCKYPEGKQL